jgi:hypothetical protein
VQFLNHYSAPIVWLLLIAGGALFVWRRGRKPHQWVILTVSVGVIAVVWWLCRPVAKLAPPIAKQPWLLEIQSPYCLACLAQKSAVDQVEREFEGKLAVRRVDIQSPEGKKLSGQYRIERTPSFIFFNEAGEEIWRIEGKIDAARVQESLRGGAK